MRLHPTALPPKTPQWDSTPLDNKKQACIFFKPTIHNEIYAFDEAAFTVAVRDRSVDECRGLAAVHGGVVAAVGATDNAWRICDTSHSSFGELVPAAVLSDDQQFVERGDQALVRVDGKWTHASNIS